MQLRTHLLLLTLVALLPVAIFAAITGYFLVQEQRETFRRGAEERTRALLSAVDAELRGAVDTIQALSLVEPLARDDLALFRATARRVLASHPGWININLALPNGERVLDLLLAEGSPLPPVQRSEKSFDHVLETRKPAVGDLAVGPVSKRWNYTVRVPVVQEGAVKYVLSAVIEPTSIVALVAEQNLPAGWVGLVLDGNNRIVARTVEPEKSRGQLASQSLREALALAPSGWFRGTTIEGAHVYTPYHRSRTSGWAFAMGIPASAVDAAAWRAYGLLAAGLLGALVLAFASARIIGRRISEPIAVLASATESVRRGDRVAVPQPAGVAEVERFARTLQECLQELRQAEERMRSVVDHIVDGIITIDERGAIQTFNPAAETIFGYAAAEVIGQNVRMLMPDPYRREHDGYIANYVRTGQAKIIGIGREVEGRRKDGSTFPLDLAVSVFYLGSRRHFTGVVRDIAERKRAEQALREADRHKDEFLAMLSHELRNPLAALTTAAHVLRAAAPDDSRTAGAQGVIDRQTQHMVRLIEDLLDITRVRLGKLSLKREPMDLGDLVSEVTQSKRRAGDLSGRATVNVDASTVWIDADRARMEQVYSNLLDNALKFTPASGAIQVRVRQDGPEAVLAVADNGQGIPAETLPTIFELFVQGEQNLARASGGLGLGLALVRRLAELQGGKISAASGGVGRGATFTVSLPAIEAPSGLHRPGAARPRAERKPLRVLVVEDNQDARQMLRAVLTMQGHDVREAADGAGGLAAAAEIDPDVVLLDIGLPDMDGYEVARRLRAVPGGRPMVLIAISGYGREDDRGRAQAAGFDAHVVKPAGVDQIVEEIDRLVDRDRVPAR